MANAFLTGNIDGSENLSCFVDCDLTHPVSVQKKPIPLFQLIPHLQCWSPINCCFILRPQLGQTLLFLPIIYKSRLSGFNRKSMMPIITIPFSLRHSLILSFTTMIFLKESSMRTNEFCSCSIFSWSGIANAD